MSGGSAATRDVVRWLHEKLDDPWGGDNVAPLLTAEQLREIAQRFATLDATVKAKVLVAVLHLRKKKLVELHDELTHVWKAAAVDDDPWVA